MYAHNYVCRHVPKLVSDVPGGLTFRVLQALNLVVGGELLAAGVRVQLQALEL